MNFPQYIASNAVTNLTITEVEHKLIDQRTFSLKINCAKIIYIESVALKIIFEN